MSFRITTPGAIGTFVLIALASCSGLNTKDHPPLVYALNLSSKTTTLSLVKDDNVLTEFLAVEPSESRPLTKVAEADAVVLRSNIMGDPAHDWTDTSGAPYVLRFERGHLYAIIVDPHGQTALYSIPESYSDDPKLTIVNSFPATLSQIQVAPDWAKNVKVYSQDVVPVVPSEFYSLDPQTLGLYWQTTEQALDGAHTVANDSEGRPLRQVFSTGRYYLFLTGDGTVRDLTPNVD